MPDISMCASETCPLKEKCYRHTAKANPHWQAWFSPKSEGKDCEYFWSNEGRAK